jgi:hypothetical protein
MKPGKGYEMVPYGVNKVVMRDWEWYWAKHKRWVKTSSAGEAMGVASDDGRIKYRRPLSSSVKPAAPVKCGHGDCIVGYYMKFGRWRLQLGLGNLK